MNSMFENCISLIELPDFSKWDTFNVLDISNMFCSCNSLKKIPDISVWNTENVIHFLRFKNTKKCVLNIFSL